MTKVLEDLKEKWNTKYDFLFVTIGSAIGLGNLWRFPYLCYKNGGGAFLVPYFIGLLLIALPHVILQSALGQYTKKSSIKAWEIVPVMRGLGFASLALGFSVFTVYATIISWSLRYLYVSFFQVLPWTTCDNPWNTANCTIYKLANLGNSTINYSLNGTNYKVSSAVEYWENNVLNVTSGIHNLGKLKPDLTICMFITWGIAFLCVFKSINWTSKVTYITASLPPVMILSLFIRGITLDGALEGMEYFVTTNITKLTELEVWEDAILQNVYSLSIASSMLIAMGSYNTFNHNFYRDSIILCVANSGTSILSGFTVFATLGLMAKQQNTSIETVVESGPGLAFIVYPQALSMMPFAQFWSVLFFLTLFLLGMDSLFAYVETVITIIQDIFPETRKKWYNKSIITLGLVVFSSLIGLTTVTQGGIYVVTLVDHYLGSGWGVMLTIALESIAISWIYGADKFYGHVCDMLGYQPKLPWFKYCWKFATPVICTGLFIYCLVTRKPLTYNRDYVFPAWANVIGWLMSLLSFTFIPGFALTYAWKKFANNKHKTIEAKLSKDGMELVELRDSQ